MDTSAFLNNVLRLLEVQVFMGMNSILMWCRECNARTINKRGNRTEFGYMNKSVLPGWNEGEIGV